MRFQPTLRVVAPYYAEPVYIDALAVSLNAALGKLPFKPEVIIASYHGMPKDYVAKGDPYLKQCSETTALLRKKLKVDDQRLMMTFQSRFGTAEWLKPYTDATVTSLRQARRKEPRRYHARLFLRLPRDAGGDRHGECGNLPARGR